VRATAGSEDALQEVQAGKLDAALVQGGLEIPSKVQLVAALNVEPLHLLVKPELVAKGLPGLRDKRINLSTLGSGTRILATHILRYAGLEAKRDYIPEDRPYTQLESLSDSAMPDAVFMVSTMPSSVATDLVQKRGYRFLPLPFAEALRLRDSTLLPAEIPAYAYNVVPPVPAESVPTVGTRLLVVTHSKTSPEAVARLLETVLQSGFLRRANLPAVTESQITSHPELPLHLGAKRYLARNNPVLTSDTVQDLESLRSFLVSAIVGIYLFWQALRRRRFTGFDVYLSEVTALEKQAHQLEEAASLDIPALIVIRNRLSTIKTEALEKFTAGNLRGEELMNSFLIHVTDVRNYLNQLILSERERIAEQSSDSLPDIEQEQRFQEGWSKARAKTIPPPESL
jgi:TRAP-type uncharacterized transport system substrate-binding protein